MRQPTVRRRTRRSPWTALPVIALALLVTACSGNTSALTSTTTSPPRSTGTVPGSTTTTALPPVRTYPLYFLRGTQLGVADRTGASTSDPHYTSIKYLVDGTIPTESAAGLTTDVPPGTTVRGLQIRGGIATLNLSPQFAAPGPPASLAGRLAQVVYTLTNSSSVTGVVLEVAGNRLVTFAGVDLAAPVGRSQVTAALPLVLLEQPAVGSSLTGSLTISGLTSGATTYIVQLVDPAGKLLTSVTNTAASGGSFQQSVPFTIAAPETGTLRLFARPTTSDETPQQFQFTLPIAP